jgi:hypothetical protein
MIQKFLGVIGYVILLFFAVLFSYGNLLIIVEGDDPKRVVNMAIWCLCYCLVAIAFATWKIWKLFGKPAIFKRQPRPLL